MGYESRLFIANASKVSYDTDAPKQAETIAVYDCCVMSPVFVKRFDKPVDFTLYGCESGRITEDKYGKPLMYATLDETIACLERYASEQHYRRVAPILGLLKAFKENEKEWDNIVVVHYGY